MLNPRSPSVRYFVNLSRILRALNSNPKTAYKITREAKSSNISVATRRLKELESYGLVRIISEVPRTYEITEKGKSCLNHLTTLLTLLGVCSW